MLIDIPPISEAGARGVVCFYTHTIHAEAHDFSCFDAGSCRSHWDDHRPVLPSSEEGPRLVG